MKRFIVLLTILLLGSNLWAQHSGFSKRYRYSGDTLQRAELVSALTYDTIDRQFFFCAPGILIPSGTWYTTFYQADEHGNILKETIDSLYYGSIGYNCVAEGADGYLYWGGYSFVFGDTTTTSWKIRKTDKNLNVIWDKLYHSPYGSNLNYNIKMLDSNRLILACYDYTLANSLGLPVKPSTPLMRIIDTAGNIITDVRPLELNYTDAYGIERTNDGGFMINGTSNTKGYIMKTDSAGNHLWHRFYGTNASKAWLLGMCRQPGVTDHFYHAGEIMADANTGNAYALKTDSAGAVLWEKRIAKGDESDAFFSVASGTNESILFVGDAYISAIQAARGWMIKMDKDGHELWNKLYTTPHLESDHDYLYKVIPLPDGGYAGAGSTFAQDVNGNWTQHAWLLRVDSNGCYDAACTEYTAVKNVAPPKEEISLFPNPSPGPLHLIKTTPFPAGTTVTLSDISGKVLHTLESPAGKTQQVYQLRGGLLPGIYVLRIAMGDQVIEKKWVLTF